MSDIQDWSKKFNAVISETPKEVDILTTSSGDKAVLRIELEANTPPFIFGLAYVPEILSDDVHWCLQSKDSWGQSGLKCILLPRARTQLLRKIKLDSDVVEVKSLRVIRVSKSGNSLLCEVETYAE